MPILKSSGNIFQSKAAVLACPVNIVGAMGAGLALAFKQRHPDLYYHYKKMCRKRRLGKDTLMIAQPVGVKYSVLLVPTKTHWSKPSDPEMVKRSIKHIAELIKDKPIESLALPMLGCGLGGLNSSEVLAWMNEYLNDSPIPIYVYCEE